MLVGEIRISNRDEYVTKCRKFVSHLNEDPDSIRKKYGEILLQTSSGSTGEPIIVPRLLADVADVFVRASRYFVRRYGHPPKRIAMLGGISHFGAAQHLSFDKVELVALKADEIGALRKFSPDVVSCYPSILRELLNDRSLRLPDLKAIKLGGERVFSTDVKKTSLKFAGVQLLEQYGSTEMPAVAFREHGKDKSRQGFELETRRFRIADLGLGGWHELLVQDLWEALLVRAEGYYRTGDEVLVRQGRAIDIRRIGDKSNPFFGAAEKLLAAGCVNVQFDLNAGRLMYVGDVDLPRRVKANARWFETLSVDRLRTDRRFKQAAAGSVLKKHMSIEDFDKHSREAPGALVDTSLHLQFTASEAKERALDDLVEELYRHELGITVKRPPEGKCSFYRVLVAEYEGRVIAGLKVYVAGRGFGEALPTELDCVPMRAYHAKRFGPDSPYCEVCRVVVSKPFRRFDLQRRLIEFVVTYLQEINCPACYWFASRAQTEGSHRVVRSLKGKPEVLGVVTVNRGPKPRDLYWSCVPVRPAPPGSA